MAEPNNFEFVRYDNQVPNPNNSSGGGPGRPSRSTIYDRLDTHVADLHDRLGGLPSPTEAEGIWHEIWLEEAHHSTAIEGNTLVLRQVEKLLDEGRAVGNKELREYMEVQGYAAAANWVYGRGIGPAQWQGDALLSLTEVRYVHELVMQPVWEVAPHAEAGQDERPGSLRRHDIEPFPAGMKPPSWTSVPEAMERWLATMPRLERAGPADGDPLPERLAKVHAEFEQIHPFLDGNGRTGRLILNLLLARIGYPPAVIYKRDRDRYLQALRRADSGDHGPLGEMIARAILNSLYRFIVPAVAGPARLIPVQALADRRITSDALRVAAIRGRLQAARAPDGSWLSSRRWVEDYLRSRHRRPSS